MEFPPEVKALMGGLDIARPPDVVVDPAIPIDLKLVHAEGLQVIDATDVVRDLGRFTLNLDTISLGGIGLDPQRGTLTVDLAQIVPDLTVAVGDLALDDVNVELGADVALKDVATHPPFTSYMTSASVLSVRKIMVADEPAVGALLEIDTGISAELRTVSSVSGTGPFEVTLAEALLLPHVVGASVTQVATLRARDVDPAEATTSRNLPYGHHLGTRILGQVGRVTGSLDRVRATLKQVQQALGRISGSIGPQPGAATIRLPGLQQIGDTAGQVIATVTHTVSSVANGLPPGAVIHVEWEVKNPSGRVLTGYPDLLVTKGTLSGPLNGAILPIPSVVLLPTFGDLGAESTSLRTISCTVTLKAAGFADHVERLGPVSVRVPQLPVPTILAMTEHSVGAADFPGAVLVAIPPHYEIANWELLKPPLEAVDRLIKSLKLIVPNLPQPLADLGFTVGLMLDLLSVPGRLSVLRRNEVLDLWWETRFPGWPHNWQDVISSIVLLGAEGRVVSCHNRPNLWSGTGAFRLITGPLPAAVLKSLWFKASSEAEVVPSDSRVVVDTQPERHFNDVLSSFQLQWDKTAV
ncbi:MAG: hypothetical protein M3314_13265 [Actinomycetota bacterium]|nr:hypothetical protein [Actinomycetota bacterium]